MKFCIDNYSEDTVMHCKTYKEVTTFSRYLHEHGKTWSSGESYIDYIPPIQEDICFRFHLGLYRGYTGYCTDDSILILEFSDFDWEDENDELLQSAEDTEVIDNFLNAFKVS